MLALPLILNLKIIDFANLQLPNFPLDFCSFKIGLVDNYNNIQLGQNDAWNYVHLDIKLLINIFKK